MRNTGYESAKPAPGTPLRRGHWSTQGLRILVPCWEGSGTPRDVSGHGNELAIYSTYPTLGTTHTWVGSAIRLDTASALVAVPGGAGWNVPTRRVTVLCIRQKTDSTLRNSGLFGTESAAGAAARCGAHVPYSDGVVYWDFGGFSSPNRISFTPSTHSGVQAYAFVAGERGSAIYLDGQVGVSQSTAITRNAVVANFDLFGVGNWGNAGLQDSIDLTFFALLDAEWTQEQVQAWVADPYLMFDRSAGVRDAFQGGGGAVGGAVESTETRVTQAGAMAAQQEGQVRVSQAGALSAQQEGQVRVSQSGAIAGQQQGLVRVTQVGAYIVWTQRPVSPGGGHDDCDDLITALTCWDEDATPRGRCLNGAAVPSAGCWSAAAATDMQVGKLNGDAQ